MKKILLLLIAIAASSIVFAQPWSKYLPKDKAKNELTLFDYQKAFNEYWKPYDVKIGYYTDAQGNKQKAHGWKQFKRWEHHWESRVNPITGEFPKTSAAEEFKKYFGENKPQSNMKESWTSLGTNSSAGGYAGIGRINTIEFHPSNDDIFWIGAAAGGLWVTEDAGSTWATYTDNLDVLGVSAIVVPSDFATSNTLYIGTGDRDAHDNNSNGVLKSTDGGITWNPTGLTFNLSDGETVNRMLLHPDDDETIFAATSDGFYITTDAGATWSKTYAGEFIDFEMCAGYPDTLFASTRNGGFYTTFDGGQNWSSVHSSNSGQRVELAVSADQPNVVYAVAANGGNGLEAIYKSTDYGNTYSNVFNSYNLLGWESNGGGNTGQGWYDLSMAADPTDGDIVFVGGVNTWKSTDGGTTWQIVSHWSGSGAPAVHADKHWLGYRHNTSTLFECNDGGVYISTNGDSFTDLTNGMTISQIYRIGVAQTDPHATVAGLQDNGTKFYNGTSWEDVLGGDGMDCAVDYTNENIQYGSLYYGDIYRTNNAWSGSSYNITDNIPGGASGAWVTPFVLDPNDNSTIYVGMSTLWKSTDKGNNFTSIGSMGSNLKSLTVAPSNSDVIYAATNSTIRKTTNGGTDWDVITSNLPVSSSSIKYIGVKANDPNTLWVALSGYNGDGVYESTNGGSSWTNISSGIPSIPVNCVIQNKLETTQIQLYAGTDYGVYIKNGSADWELYSNGLPNVIVNELEIYYDFSNPPASKLRACTYGRGLWEAGLELSGSYAPYVSTASVSNISTTSADFNGEILNDFGTTITESGIVYSTEPNPIVGGENCIAVQTSPLVASGEFTVSTTDLEEATMYYFKAYATNSIGIGYGGELSFVTDCNAISDLPFAEDVESSNAMPICWSEEFVSGDNLSWQIATGNGTFFNSAHSGENNFLLRDANSDENKTILQLPAIDISSVQAPALKFWVALPVFFGSNDKLRVLYRTSETASWTELGTLDEAVAEWTEKYFQLPEASSTYYIGFEGNAIYGGGVCIDDISVVESEGISSAQSEGVYVYPNPTKDLLNVNINEQYIGAELNIIDLSGKTIINVELQNTTNRIDVQKLSAGIYIIELGTKDKVIQQKIVIE